MAAMADIPGRRVRPTAVTAGRAASRAMVGPALRVGADTIRRQAVEDITQRRAAEGITPAEDAPLAEAVGTPPAVDIRVVAAIQAAEGMAAAIAEKLGDGTSLREAAT